LSIKTEVKRNYGPAAKLAIISMLLCGLVFPLAVTGLAQVLLHDQASGSFVQLNGKNVGSNYVAQNFTRPYFFHPRNASLSASGVDPDITLEDALSQIPRISYVTGIDTNVLSNLVSQNKDGTLWIFGSPYVNVIRLNLALIHNFQTIYCSTPPLSYCE
jgi:K+-transporting ATPase ATPase C chain